MLVRQLIVKGLVGVSVLTTGVGSAYWYMNSTPKNIQEYLTWTGIKLAESELDFKIIFTENKDNEDFKKKNITSKTKLEEGYKELKKWCEDRYSKPYENKNDENELETMRKYCKNEIKTVHGLLIKNSVQDSENDTSDDEYQKIFAYYKSEDSFINTIKESTDISNATSNSEGKNTLKKWCEKALKTSINNATQVNQVVWYCFPLKFETLKDTIEKSNSSWNQSDDYSKSFGKWKNTEKFIELLKSHDTTNNKDLSKDTEDENGKDKMQKWCEDNLNKKIKDIENYKEIYSYIYHACMKSHD